MAFALDSLALADWRRRVAELYAEVRRSEDPVQAWRDFREGRDALFKTHPQSPLTAEQRADFLSLSYFPYDPAWRVMGTVETNVERETFATELAEDGALRYTRVGRVLFAIQGELTAPVALGLFWIEGYGGGLFLPFGDGSNGRSTYGGGRYLYDTIKGADLNKGPGPFVLDFNFAYNPSCAYNVQWSCPLPPAENRLPFAVRAGERDWNT